MKKQKVLLIHNYYQIPGGEDTVVANEKKLLEDNGHEVVVYYRNNSEINEMNIFQKFLIPFITVFNVKTYRQVRKIIKEEHIDIVHVHNTLNLISPSVYYAALSCKIPVVQTVHNFRLLCPAATFYRGSDICEECLKKGFAPAIKYGCYRKSRIQTLGCVITLKFHRITGIYGKINYICLTEFNKKKILNLKQIKEKNIFVKPNFVDSRMKSVPYNQRVNQIIFVGRIEKLKGVDILLQAWKLIGTSGPRLIMCGIGPMEEWCRKYIIENRLQNVEMKGFIPNDEVKKMIAGSRALILPTQCYEGFPMTIIEALSVGTPVLCSDLGNAGNLVIEGKTGCKFAPHMPKEIMEAVNRLTMYGDMTDTVMREYEERYSKKKNYEMLQKIYELCM